MSIRRAFALTPRPVSRGLSAAVACLAIAAPVAAAVPAQAATAAVPAQATAQAQTSPSTATLQALAEKAVDSGVTGLVIRQDDGRHAVRVAAGVSRVEPRRDAQPGDGARIGSITKTFMATLALQLVGEGRLSLDDPVSKHLPGLLPGGDRITVRMLLNHTSGLYNYTDDPAVQATFLGRDSREWTPQELVAVAAKRKPVFGPGTSWAYSNTNYVVAGLLLEKVSGHSVDGLLTHRIIRPLGLTGTYLARTPAWRGAHLHGYEQPATGKGLVDTSRRPISWAWTAGAVVSTADDLDQFLTALLSGRLLPPALLAEMKKAAPKSPGYGLGLYALPTPCGRVWGHDGGLPGYASLAYTDDGGRRSVVLFLPTQPTEASAPALEAVASTAICGMFGKPVPAVAATSGGPAVPAAAASGGNPVPAAAGRGRLGR